MVRSKIDKVIELFEWTEEEKYYLSKLSREGSSVKWTLKSRQRRHLIHFFELTRTLTIAPIHNRTANPPGE